MSTGGCVGVCDALTLPFSSRLVNMTMVAEPCSHTIRQKSATVSGLGPAMHRKRVHWKPHHSFMIRENNSHDVP